MYVCNCAGVTHRELCHYLSQGNTNIKTLWAERGLCRGCGKCAREVGEVLKGYRHTAQNRTTSWLAPATRMTAS